MKPLKNLTALFIAVIVLLIPEITTAKVLPFLFKGARPLGMGDAFTAIADDYNAMFYNPAGINNIEGVNVEILNPLFEFSESSLQLFNDLQNIDSENVSDVTDLMRDFLGEHQHLRASLFPNFAMHNFAAGYLGQGVIDAEIRNRVNPEADVDIAIDHGPVLSGAYSFLEGKLQVGVTGKYIIRKGLSRKYTATDIADENFDPLDDVNDGTSLGIDIGAIYNFDWFLKPSVGIVFQNIGDLDFDDAGKIPSQTNLGLAIRPEFWIVHSTVTLDYKDITYHVGDDDDFFKRVHVGAEFEFPAILTLRVGLNQGYLTAGVGIDLWILNIDYAVYTEEVGSYAGQRDDRRHVFLLSLGF